MFQNTPADRALLNYLTRLKGPISKEKGEEKGGVPPDKN